MQKKRKNGRYTPEFQQYAVERMRVAVNISALAQELGVPRVRLYCWRGRLDPRWWQSTDMGESFIPPDREKFSLQQQLREAKQLLAEKTLEVDFFQRCLAENRGSTPEERKRWRDSIYQQIREMMSLQGSLSIERMCRLAGVSRAGFYRQLERSYGVEQDMKLRSEMQRIALQHRRRYGYRRITAELQQRGFQVNGKRVLRLLREDNLLSLRQRKFVVTTQSQPELEIYLNLLGG